MSASAQYLSLALLALYYVVLTTLALYGSHRLVLLALYARSARRRTPLTPSGPEDAELPRVTVQLPIYNELYVATRLIDAVCAFDYPRNRLEIQVLDDSSDDTSELVAACVAAHRGRGLDIRHIQRPRRSGYKAGALAHGLSSSRGELVAIFDADFIPRPDFLRRTVPWFGDPEVGMVQARWEHINRDYSLLTRIQAILLDGHFALEHVARAESGRFFNFNGTAGIWRRRAIEESGGWSQRTLTEDLDLSYRAQLAGWRFRFLPATTAPAELPVDIHGFKRQQFRWAKGSIQTARHQLGRVLRADIGLATKFEAAIHLTNNFAYPFMILLSALVFPAMVVRHNLGLHWLTGFDLGLFTVSTLSILLFYTVSQWVIRPRRIGQAIHLLSLMALGIGLSVNNTRAVLSGLTDDGGTFERTPKYRIESSRDRWKRKRYRASRDATFAMEGLMALYMAATLFYCWRLEMWAILPFLILFFCGYAYVFTLSVSRLLSLSRFARATEDGREAAADSALEPASLQGMGRQLQ